MGGISKEEMCSHKILARKEIFMQDRWCRGRTTGLWEKKLNGRIIKLSGRVPVIRVDNIKETLGNVESEVGSDIVKRALGYPMKLIAKNVGQISLENRHP
ncbi:hypothetical protein Tco_1118198 [Tanacetum coccineum]